MVWQWCRFAAAALCLALGIAFMILAVFGVNRFKKALNRMHAAAIGDTLGILFVFLGLILIRGFSFDSLKLFLVILFFWMASPVSGHMISRLEAMTDENLGELSVIHREFNKDREAGKSQDRKERLVEEAGKGQDRKERLAEEAGKGQDRKESLAEEDGKSQDRKERLAEEAGKANGKIYEKEEKADAAV